MLVGLPEGAVLITAGDNDTYGPLALQAGMQFRTDVVILNRSLLNVPEYAEAMFDRHASIRPDYDIPAHETVMVDGVPKLLSDALIRLLIERNETPIHVTASANTSGAFHQPETHIEGINLRTSTDGLTPDASARLFLEEYRLDSATDWTYPWSVAPNVAKLVRNYVAAMTKLVEKGELSEPTRARLIARASSIASFHDWKTMKTYLETLQGR